MLTRKKEFLNYLANNQDFFIAHSQQPLQQHQKLFAKQVEVG
jgi:hypothetical protein